MDTIEQYDTLTEAIEGLRQQGYVEDFNINTNCIECRNGKFSFSHDEFRVDKVFRFYGLNDPGDESILYAISSEDDQIKGVLVNGFGPTSAPLTAEMMQKLS